MVVLSGFGQTTPSTEKEQIIRQAQQSYYSLSKEGMNEFRCQIKPDWDAFYASVHADEVGQNELRPLLKGLHFDVVVGPNGASTVSHHFDSVPPNEQVAERLRTTISGLEQVITGFFQTWSGFMVKSVFPDPRSEYGLEQKGDEYRLTMSGNKTLVVVDMSQDLTIVELHVNSPKFDAILHPRFSPSDRGRILSGYDSTNKVGTDATKEISVNIEYSSVEGLSVPGAVKVAVKLPSTTIVIPLGFSDCSAKKR